MSGPLSGIKVVELATFVAAPVTARLLADLGAEVIKVEAPGGDAWRNSGISFRTNRFSAEENPVFDIYNTGKKHISLNLKSPEGKEALHKLLSQADIFVTNTRPAALKRLGFSYEDLKDLYPRLIYAIVLGYGENGPEAATPAFDTTAFWSRSGFLRDMAPVTADYHPVIAPYSVGDTATGFLLMGEISTALYNRTRTGKGDYVSSTLYHNGIFCMGSMTIIAQAPFGRDYPIRPIEQGIGTSYKCADDEWVYVALGDASITLPKFHRLIGHPELNDDPRFADHPSRVKNRDAHVAYFRDAFLTQSADHWVQLAKELDVTLVKMSHFRDVSEDPQAWANGFVEHVTFPNGNTDTMPSSPIEMGTAAPPPTVPAPPVGTHTAEVLRQLGYTEEQVNALLKSGAAVGGRHG